MSQQYVIWVQNTAAHATVRIASVGSKAEKAKKLAREVRREYSQIGCHDVRLFREVAF